MTDAPAAPASNPSPVKKGFLGHVFNFVASAGVGAVISVGAKTAALAVCGSQLAALVPAAVLVGVGSAAVQRGKDIYKWNQTHQECKASYVKDFLNFDKTGHDTKYYLKKGALSAAFAVVGGLIGLGVNHWLHATPAAPVHTPEITPPAHVPAVVTPPVHTPDITPPPLHTPDVTPPVHVQTPDEKLADLLNNAKSHIPVHHCKGIDGALHRLDSTHENVRAQAIKDLGYYFANGRCGVTENDALADKLFQASIEVSHGHNIQALHDLGYQTLHGFGTAQDSGKAYDLLSKAAAGGHPLSPPILDYMKIHHMVPKAH